MFNPLYNSACPCTRGCPDRSPTCHGNTGECKRNYIGWKESEEVKNEKIRKIKFAENLCSRSSFLVIT